MVSSTYNTFRGDRCILYSLNVGDAEAIPGGFLNPEDFSPIAGRLLIPAGTFVDADMKPLKRVETIAPTSGDSAVLLVSNPCVLLPGDTIHLASTPFDSPTLEYNRLTSAELSPIEATVASVNSTTKSQSVVITISSIAVGNYLEASLQGFTETVVSASANAAEAAIALKNKLVSMATSLGLGSSTTVTVSNNTVTVSSDEVGEIIPISVIVAQGSGSSVGTASVAYNSAVGAITLTQPIGTDIQAGSRFGALGQTPAGVLIYDFFLESAFGNAVSRGAAAYHRANIDGRYLPYFDEHIKRSLPGLYVWKGKERSSNQQPIISN